MRILTPILAAALAASASPDDEEPTMTADSKPASRPAHTNRLAGASSPYLLQHAHNPVDWYEWGPEALERARREDKPIFLSIGYSACHWCHVMAHESFENEAIAAILNRHFVNVKVDREERPDLDDIYMQATMILNQGQGGWPMSVWLTPDLEPFFAGTYFPPDARWGRPGFGRLCERIGELWRTNADALRADAEKLAAYVAASLGDSPARGPSGAGPPEDSAPHGCDVTLAQIDRTVDLLTAAFDAERGGLVSGGTNKFPPSMALDLLMRSAHRRRDDEARRGRILERVEVTLERMARGGVYDQLAGGVARYSTDVDWLVPHFEKMLYDQALVGDAYVDAFQLTGKPLYSEAARGIFDYVLADLGSPLGAFYSSRDADSEGQEGKFYVWTRGEIVAALGRDDAELFCSFYDVSDAGNWRDPHEPGVAKNILHVPRPLEVVAKLIRIEPAELERRLAAARGRLLEVRNRRVPPARDEKIVCEWNGLMIASLARAGCVLNEPRYIDAASRAADCILTHMYHEGRLRRSYRERHPSSTARPSPPGDATPPVAFLSDYACLIEGLIELYEATFDRRWLDRALQLNRVVIERFGPGGGTKDAHRPGGSEVGPGGPSVGPGEARGGGFFFTADDHEPLIARARDVRDSAVPSGNSVQLMNLMRLSVMLGDHELRRLADRSVAAFAADVLAQPGSGERFLAAVEFGLAGPVEIAIVGDPRHPATQRLLRTVHETYLPNRVLMLLDPARPGASPNSPLLEQRPQLDGLPTAYVCRNYACRRPATTPEELRAQLSSP